MQQFSDIEMNKALSFLLAVSMAFAVQAQNTVSVRIIPELSVLSKTGTTTLSIAYETDTATLPIAYQIDIILPEGIVPAGAENDARHAVSLDNTDGVYPVTFPGVNTPVHQITCSWQADKRVFRILCFSMSNVPFTRSTGKLLKIRLKPESDNLAQGSEAIIRNATFVMPDMKKCIAPETKITIQLSEEDS